MSAWHQWIYDLSIEIPMDNHNQGGDSAFELFTSCLFS
jgi:hypothetical protein